jgi:hypothetical protein
MNLEQNKTYRTRTGKKIAYDIVGNKYPVPVGTVLKFLRFEERPFECVEMERKEEKYHHFPVFQCEGGMEVMVPQVKMMWYPDFKNYPEYKLDNSVDLMFGPV